MFPKVSGSEGSKEFPAVWIRCHSNISNINCLALCVIFSIVSYCPTFLEQTVHYLL
jgi:hypothetical protein